MLVVLLSAICRLIDPPYSDLANRITVLTLYSTVRQQTETREPRKCQFALEKPCVSGTMRQISILFHWAERTCRSNVWKWRHH